MVCARMICGVLLGLMVVGFGAGCAGTDPGPRKLPLVEKWNGDYPVAELDRLPADQRETPVGVIADADRFRDVWDAFMPATETPEVDFDKHVAVFARNLQFYNRINIGKLTLRDGVAEVVAMETRSAMPIEDKVAMSLTVVPRRGVSYIQAGDVKIPVPAPPRKRRGMMGY